MARRSGSASTPAPSGRQAPSRDGDPVPQRLDDIMRWAITATDPLRGQEPRPAPTVAELMLAARTRSRARRRSMAANTPWVRWGAPLAVSMMAAAAVGAVWLSPASSPSVDQHVAVPAVLNLEFPGEADPARQRLRELADTIAAMNDNRAGQVTHIRLQTWSLDQTPPGPPGAGVIARDEQIWWAPDHSGRRVVVTLPSQPRGFQQSTWIQPLPPDITVGEKTFRYGTGEISVVIDNPSTDPAILAGQLASHQPALGPDATLRAVADLYRYHDLSAAQRAAVLRVLVNVDGLLDRGVVVDRAGRSGLCVSADSFDGGTREVLILDPATGRVLGYEEIALRQPRLSAGPAPTVISYVAYLVSEHINGF